jgi:hypothetical protein
MNIRFPVARTALCRNVNEFFLNLTLLLLRNLCKQVTLLTPSLIINNCIVVLQNCIKYYVLVAQLIEMIVIFQSHADDISYCRCL